MTKLTPLAIEWLPDYDLEPGPFSLEPVIMAIDLDVPAIPDDWLQNLWAAIDVQHFAGALPPITLAWAENLCTPARLERPDVVLLDTCLMSVNPDQVLNAIRRLLLHVAVCVYTLRKGSPLYGPAFRATATRIGASMGWKPVGTAAEAKRWPMGF